VQSPAIGSVALAGGKLIISGTNGIPGTTCYLLTSTNLALPMSNWTRLATNVVELTGGFYVTNLLDGSNPERFYRLRLGP
jgi:hypothetical protein